MRAAPHKAGAGDVVYPRWLLARTIGIFFYAWVVGAIWLGAVATIAPLLWVSRRVAAPLVGPTVAEIAACVVALPVACLACMAILYGSFPAFLRLERLLNGRCPRCGAFAIVDEADLADVEDYASCEQCRLHLADVGPGRAWREVGAAEWSDLQQELAARGGPAPCGTCGALLSPTVAHCHVCGSRVPRSPPTP